MNKPNPNSYQISASDPNKSVWVSASAGTGKTKILVDRILRLLLKGENIENIICITYTKIAAQEMINRLMSILSTWSILNEEQLKEELHNLTNENATSDTLLLAKRLFSNILNQLHNIKIQTIHSFCQQILAKFPIEANVPNKFYVIEDNIAKELRKEVVSKILNLKYSNPNDQRDLLKLIKHISHKTFTDYMDSILNSSNDLHAIISHYKIHTSWHNYTKSLYDFFKADMGTKSHDIYNDFFNSNNLPLDDLKNIVLKMEEKNIEHKKFNQSFMDFLSNGEKNFIKYCEFFLTQKNEPIKTPLTKEHIKKLGDESYKIQDTINKEVNRILDAINRYKNHISAEINLYFMQLSIEIYNAYQFSKEQASLVDFNDLIIKTYDLITKNHMHEWILYKLDNQINHILVDEAQDTSPLQWEIIKYFTSDFFSGKTAKENNRTIFIVGDIKQSIYSFQGADPQIFDNIKDYFKNKILSSGNQYEEIQMNISFRSSMGITNCVNTITNNLFNNQQKPYINENFNHISYHQNKSSNVEIWPTLVPTNDDNNTRHKNLAIAITEKIKYLHKNYHINYSDILILYKKRDGNTTLKYLIKLLKNNNIPILGIDKLNLKDDIAILDLIALSKFLLQNKDDFSLCCVLKSPLFNLNDTDIANLKQNNPNISIFDNLSLSQHKWIYDELLTLIEKSKTCGVFDLFFHILYHSNGLEKFISRLGLEAMEPISEFMNLILNQFQTNHMDNLQSFLHYILEHNQSIKRDTSDKTDSVNLLTIHGSKGLESKIVFLLNDLDAKNQTPNILHNKNFNNPLLLLNLSQNIQSTATNNLLEEYKHMEQEEQKRLLYVAITRPKEELYICSNAKHNPQSEEAKYKNNVWFQPIYNATMDNNIFKESINSFFDETKGFTTQSYHHIEQRINLSNIQEENPTIYPLPSWYNNYPPTELPYNKPLSPSKIDFEDQYFLSPLDIVNTKINPKINKGIIIHKILEQLNYIKSNHMYYVEKFLNNISYNLSKVDKQDILNNIKNIINHPQLDFLFSHQSLNEVFISGMLEYNNELQIVSARVDKIIKLEDTIIIIDYKFAKKKKNIPQNYINQMNIYKTMVQNIYPKYKILTYILLTQDVVLLEIK